MAATAKTRRHASHTLLSREAACALKQDIVDSLACHRDDAQEVIGSVHRDGQDTLLAIYKSTTAPIKAPSPTVTRTPAP